MIIDWIIENLLPLTVVNEDEMGVQLKRGRYTKTVGPGIYFVCPLIDEIQTITVTTQVIDMEDQVIMIDDRPYFISVTVEYTVENAFKAMLCVQDYDEAIATITMNLVNKYQGHTEQVEDEISTKAEKWGLSVTNVSINQMAPCKVFKVVQ
jgi:regulator of protease activity HflC (stomatin/prohibitin superfamily)